MDVIFPSEEWLKNLESKLNSDAKYRKAAENWEGDLLFDITPEGSLTEPFSFYLDLWHGTCRKVEYNPDTSSYPTPAFTLATTYENITSILTGKLHPVTAMMSMKLKVQGNMGYVMRNVPSVTEFVRCAQEVTNKIM